MINNTSGSPLVRTPGCIRQVIPLSTPRSLHFRGLRLNSCSGLSIASIEGRCAYVYGWDFLFHADCQCLLGKWCTYGAFYSRQSGALQANEVIRAIAHLTVERTSSRDTQASYHHCFISDVFFLCAAPFWGWGLQVSEHMAGSVYILHLQMVHHIC